MRMSEVTQDDEETQLKREEDNMIHRLRAGSTCGVVHAVLLNAVFAASLQNADL